MNSTAARRLILIALLINVLALAYFYCLDRWFFSTRFLTPIFGLLLAVYDPPAAWIAVLACLIAAAWTRPAPILKIVDALAAHPRRVVLFATLVIAAGAVGVYHDYPFAMDEYAAVFQAKIFATGHLYARLPPAVLGWLIVPGFNGAFLIASHLTGHAIEAYWPGFALLLAPFELIRMPWLCNAVLSGAALYLVYRITLSVTGDRRSAGWALLFALASSAFLAYGISYYAMQAHLTLNLLYAYLLLSPNRWRSFAAGCVGGFALILHNPFPHTMFALPWIASLAWDPRRRRYLVPLILGYLPIAAPIGIGWLALRGHIQSVTHDVAAAQRIVHGVFVLPNYAIVNMRTAAAAKMIVWAVPGLFVLAFAGWRRGCSERTVNLLAMSALTTFLGYMFVQLDQGHGWGYRYFHSAWGSIPILAAIALTGEGAGMDRLRAFAGMAAITSLALLVPFQMFEMHAVIGRHLAQVPPPRRPGNDVYFLNPRVGFYVSDMIQIDPSLRDRDLYLMSRGATLDRELVRENWPEARVIDSNPFSTQWYLGPVDHRVTTDGTGGAHFVLRYSARSAPASASAQPASP